MTYTYKKQSAYKTVSYKPQGLAAEMIWEYCKWEGYRLLRSNPQNLIREALYEYGVITKKQLNAGDPSCWEPGETIKISLYRESMDELDKAAEVAGTTRQQVIEDCVINYLTKE